MSRKNKKKFFRKWSRIDQSKSPVVRSQPVNFSGKYVGLDLGAFCGIAVKDGLSIIADTWDLNSKKRIHGSGMKFLLFKSMLKDVLSTGPISSIFYEEVRRHKGVSAAHAYGGYESHLLAFCEENNIPFLSIPVGTVKAFATGKGNASKDMMILAARKKWPSIEIGPKEDDKADALWILFTGLNELGLE